MSARAFRLARFYTPECARRTNAKVANPEQSQVVKPNELESALTRAVHTYSKLNVNELHYMQDTPSWTETSAQVIYYAAFLLAHEYLRAHCLPGLVDQGKFNTSYKHLTGIADRHIAVANGKLGADGLLGNSKV